MAGPIRVDLESAEQCKATNMIEFLYAFCRWESNERGLVRNKESLEQAFEEVKKIAKLENTPLATHLSKL